MGLKRRLKRLVKAEKERAKDPFGPFAPSLPTIAGSIKKAAQHPSPRNIASAALTTSAISPVGLGGVGKARTPGYARSATEVFKANRARTAATRTTRIRSIEIPAVRAQLGAAAGRSGEVAASSIRSALKSVRTPSRSTFSKSVRAGAAAGATAALMERVKSPSRSAFHPLRAEESPAEGLRKVAAASRLTGPIGTRALIEGQRAARSTFYAAGNRSMTSSQKKAVLGSAVQRAFASGLKEEERNRARAAALRVTRQ